MENIHQNLAPQYELANSNLDGHNTSNESVWLIKDITMTTNLLSYLKVTSCVFPAIIVASLKSFAAALQLPDQFEVRNA